MPPPPPNFLPNRRQRLDPTRRMNSRELWNQVRFHSSASTSNNNASTSSNRAKWAMALLRAIAYELQPFRIKPCFHRAVIFIRDEDGLKRVSQSIIERAQRILSLLSELFRSLHRQLKQTDVHSIKAFILDNKSLLAKSSIIIIALRLYYHGLLYLHELLHAGPIIVICTLLILLYTIGLGDNTGAGSGIPSAYSVFNRGMRRIMGTVDGEELARQYAGGMAAAGGRGVDNNNNMNAFEDDDDWVLAGEEEGGEEEEQNLVNEQRRQRRLERLQQRREQEGNGVNDGAAEPQDNNDTAIDHSGNDALEGESQDDGQENRSTNEEAAAAATSTAKKSGKKARRRNLEVRREMQRQRQAAADMGFAAEENVNDMREMQARMALE